MNEPRIRAPLIFEKRGEKGMMCLFCKNILPVSDKIKLRICGMVQCKKCGRKIYNNSIFY